MDAGAKENTDSGLQKQKGALSQKDNAPCGLYLN